MGVHSLELLSSFDKLNDMDSPTIDVETMSSE